MGKRKILIIDDDPDLSKLLAMLLRANGYGVCCALDGHNGFMLAEREKPDLILLDIKMPGKGGLSAYKDIRQSSATASIPILLMSGLSRDTVETVAKEIDANGFVHKPCDSAELLAKIKEALKE